MPPRKLSDYTTGTITATNGSRVVTGSGTGWLTTINGATESTIATGDMLIVSTGRPVMIESVDSATQLTLVEAWPNATAGGTAYKVRRYVALPAGAVLAALQSVEARGTDSNALTSWTIDGGTTRLKMRQASGGQGALAAGATGAADGSLVDAVLISSTGNVGIRGAPTEELDVVRSQNATTTARVYNSTSGTAAAAEFVLQTGTPNSSLAITALDNNAVPYVRMRTGSAATALYRDAVVHVWRNQAGTTEFMRIASDGSIGINRSSPLNTLDINGSLGRSAPVTKTGSFTLADTENWVIVANASAITTVTLPAASTCTGREVMMKNLSATYTVVSASSNVVPLTSATAGTAILAAGAGKWCCMVSNGTNWVIMQGG